MKNLIARLILRRKLFKGQFRLFLWLFRKNFLLRKKTNTKPIIGNFRINVDIKNFIDACIYFTGDYEPYLKMHFTKLITPGMVVLDVGANIGFHTLYFAELTGKTGKVIAFEPIALNFKALQKNLALNDVPQVMPVNKALGSENSFINLHIDENAINPGAFNLFEEGDKNTKIECVRGDDYLSEYKIDNVDFLKIDVEGFELEVLKGLIKIIKNSKPIIIFEYDENYQAKLNEDPKAIIHFLANFRYQFFCIDGYGILKSLHVDDAIKSSEILALPIK